MVEQHLLLGGRGVAGAHVVALVSTAHLAQILHFTIAATGDAGLEGDVLWPQNDVGIVEELLIQSAGLLDSIDSPLEIVVGYCMACPTRGLDLANAYAVRRRPSSDDELFTLCALLDGLGLGVSSRVLISSRGTWWLKRCGNRCKALHLYLLAGDYTRCAALMEDALWEVIRGVVGHARAATGAFSDLTVHCESLRQSSAASTGAEALDAVRSAEDLITAYESSLVGASADNGVFEDLCVPLIQYLRAYTGLVRAALSSSFDDGAADKMKTLVQLIGSRGVPLRFCVHFAEVVVWTDERLRTAAVEVRLISDEVEALMGTVHRAISSPHSAAYLASTPPQALRGLSAMLLKLLSRALMRDIAEGAKARIREEQEQAKIAVAKRPTKDSSLMRYVMAS
jgi:hypothetical protein